jgi:hypothetical protein
MSLLDRQYLLATREANSLVSEGLTSLRSKLPDLLRDWPNVDDKQLTRHLVGRVQEIGINALHAAQSSLADALRAELPEGMLKEGVSFSPLPPIGVNQTEPTV